jgi:hypothetical protein
MAKRIDSWRHIHITLKDRKERAAIEKAAKSEGDLVGVFARKAAIKKADEINAANAITKH